MKSMLLTKTIHKARLFDMLIGTGTDIMTNGVGLNTKKVKLFRPIPRDRDQAFSKFDGALLSILMTIPTLRHMQFKDDIKNIKWFNREPYPLDLAFKKSNRKELDHAS
jgi:hypothetical protein